MIEIPEGYEIVRAIVRCKDCKYHELTFDKKSYWCKINTHWLRNNDWDDDDDIPWGADDFCSRGERKD